MPDPASPSSPATEAIAVWPCDHGGVQVESGRAKPGYRCSTCGATAESYIPEAELARLAEGAGDG